MIVAIIIIVYVLNVFLNRWLNKILHIKHDGPIIVWLWFLSVFTTLVFLIIIINEIRGNWFTGKYWK
jgi:hypothetical protein